MKKHFVLYVLMLPMLVFSQKEKDTTYTDTIYKKRVLENTELSVLTSYYSQDGNNAAVTGGIGTEKLGDFATDIKVSIPLNDDDVLTVDATISAYTSASSSNLDPFKLNPNGTQVIATPWVESSGASEGDTWVNGILSYSHSSDDRNKIYSANVSLASEYDYSSFGFGLGYTHLFNKKNTEINFSFNGFLDKWLPQYPSEITSYIGTSGNLNAGFFNNLPILDENGNSINKNDPNAWKPINTTLIQNNDRNTYSFSLGFSQILDQKTQLSVFADVVYQTGWLANPMQRVYFQDKANFYIGSATNVSNYESEQNISAFHLADDIERLPDNRLKTPIGIRLNRYINELMVFKLYYRYYFDDWGINASTINVELPIKLNNYFTIYPSYRFYTQTAADYFAPYDMHLSTNEFYTSDYDLSEFNASQFGFGIKYTDVLTKTKIIRSLKLKNISLNYAYYERNTGLKANIISLGIKLVSDK